MSADFWPGTRVRKSRGNAFDPRLPSRIDWRGFYKKAAAAGKSAAAATAQIDDKRAAGDRSIEITVTERARPVRGAA